ncbi:MAG: response regulator [Leptolyngbyaceae cyanobacterium]
MSSEPVPSQPVPSYFLQEASELLQQMDEELQTLRQDFSVQKVHTLMRIAHTLKGAAASVGLDTIKTTTHSLEDAFKALCVPGTSLSIAVEGLIFETYACLQMLLSARFTNTPLDESSILDRMADIVSQLQDNLGDQFGNDGYLPSSAELGFDMTQSIFEMGVEERLNKLEDALKHPEPERLASLLQSQADVFWGLAESLKLPGFGEISQSALTALHQSPDRVVEIAQAALEDYRAGQVKVLQGDRVQGGEPGSLLRQLSGRQSDSVFPGPVHDKQVSDNQKLFPTVVYQQPSKKPTGIGKLWHMLTRPIPGTPQISKPQQTADPQPVSQEKFSPSTLDLSKVIHSDTLSPPTPVLSKPSPLPEPAKAVLSDTESTVLAALEDSTDPSPQELPAPAVLEQAPPQAESLDAEVPSTPNNTAILRVSVDHLEKFNYVIGELLTQQNRQTLYHEQLVDNLKKLSNKVQQQQQQLSVLQQKAVHDLTGTRVEQTVTPFDQFDTLELEQYSSLQPLVQPILDNTIQQMEGVEAIDLFTHHSYQALTKQKRLVSDLRDTLFDVRMQPLESVLQRFQQVVARLSAQYPKDVHLEIKGGKVRIDRAIADKLYDPLLHLIRNAFSHGIETADIRQQHNKLDTGTIRLEASQKGHYLTIEVIDDGQGLELEKIRQKAIDNQLITPQAAAKLSPEQIYNLIFEPEFSTTSQIDALSGRGIGLSAVRSQMDALQGSVLVTSKAHQWTCFTLKIPTNLTIAKLLLCQVANKQYAMMTDTVQQIVMPANQQISTREHVKFLSWQSDDKQRLVPIFPLSDALSYRATLPAPSPEDTDIGSEMSSVTLSNPVILIESDGKLVGIEVEHLRGEQELAIHPLGKSVSTPMYVYGCSTLTSGSLSLVLDGTALVQDILSDLSQTVLDMFNAGDQAGPEAAVPLPVAPPKRTILIVDDSITVRNTLAATLQKAGYRVIQAKEGAEAIQKLHTAKVDTILCDLEMPGMNGFDFLKIQQRTPKIKAIPTIMLTSRAGSKHRKLAKELGATDYLTKPYLTPQLLEKLTNVAAQPSDAQLLEALENKYV